MRVYVTISSAFPGLFSWSELKRLDYRELMYLFTEAQVQLLEQSQDRIAQMRTAMTSGDGYQKVMDQIKQSIYELRIGKTEAVRENWGTLKKRG